MAPGLPRARPLHGVDLPLLRRVCRETAASLSESTRTIDRVVERMDPGRARTLAAQPFTYPYVGEMPTDPPPGYRRLAVREVIGSGEATFAEAADRVLSWQMQERSGLGVLASDEVARPGTVVVVTVGFGPLRITAPCRVVGAFREERRAGFTYATLPGHPFRGQESFVVEHHVDDAVTASVTAYSRPAEWFTALGAPLSGIVQKQAARRYVRALRVG
jgi:uncharacterized protein (UPF0548 family)